MFHPHNSEKKGFPSHEETKTKKKIPTCVYVLEGTSAHAWNTPGRMTRDRQATNPFFYSRSYRVEGLEMETWAVAPRASREVIFFLSKTLLSDG